MAFLSPTYYHPSCKEKSKRTMHVTIRSALYNNMDDPNLSTRTSGSTQQQCLDRRNFLKDVTAKASVSVTGLTAAFCTMPVRDALAADSGSSSTNPFDAIRYELSDPSGGVAYMQQCIDREDFPALMEFTKQYDQVLRKASIGKAKKLLPTKELQTKATEASNAVTFDLIGINRSSRPGQENLDNAKKYLQELKQDVQIVLDMESQVVESATAE